MTSCNPKDIVFGCVAENNTKFLSQALRLIQSLRWFGGTLSNAEFILCVVEGLDPSYQAHFELLGAKVRIVKRFHHANPYPNKLRFLELPEVELFYTIVLLDCDTIFVQDPADYLKTSSFQARFAGFPTVPTNVFRKLFSQFNLTLPPEEYRCSVTDYPTIWYCNDGVLIFPNKTFRNFFPFWRDFTNQLCNNPALLNDQSTFITQAALTLAFFKNPVPFSELPLELNCPIPEDSPRLLDAVKTCDPAIIHYHKRIGADGLIMKNSNPFVNKRIDDFNKKLKNHF